MNTTNAIDQTPETNYQIGTFGVSNRDVAIVTEALEIAKRMRGEGDGSLEDATRAVILLKGSGLSRDFNRCIEGEGSADVDRQIVAYMDGVAELMDRFPEGANHH
jgi:hypothetical protein